MSERPSDLPDYDNPPIAEVALGLQFSTDSPILAPHYGLYWQIVRDSFPTISHQPPMMPQIEDVTRDSPQAGEASVMFRTGAPPLPRLWLADDSGNRLIQLQVDRFLHNWRKTGGDESYPHFEALWQEFAERWSQFSDFCVGQELGTPRIAQGELTYVNHVLQGSCWETMDNIPKVLAFCTEPTAKRILPNVEAWTTSLRYRLPDSMGRLHVTAEPAIRTSDKQLMLRMALTVRGPVPEPAIENMADWFRTARRYIVEGFTELTTPEAQEHWARKS